LEDFQGTELVEGDLGLVLEIVTTFTRLCELEVGITSVKLRLTVLVVVPKFHLSLCKLDGIRDIGV
jgi:hypothetical protein